MEKVERKKLISSAIFMYILSFTKLVVPLISLPYLTRVLSVDVYGSISFVKSIITYLQVLVDFGFIYSGTRDIVNLIKGKEDINKEISSIAFSQVCLWGVGFLVILILTYCLDVLEGFRLYAILSTISVFVSIFLFEYLFRATQRMGVVTLRFAIMKVLSLILIVIFVKNDSDIILIPIFDIISSILAIIPVIFELKRLGIKLEVVKIISLWNSIKRAIIFFLSEFSTLAFSVLNTIVIGLVLTKGDVAHWSVAMQLVTAVTVLYTPIINSVYPTMIKNKNIKILHRILTIYMPLILLGCGIIWLWGENIIGFVLTEKYVMSAKILKYLIPVLIITFPSMLYSWPCFTVINKEKLNAVITILSALIQVFGVSILLATDTFSILAVVVVRSVSELVLCVARIVVVYINKKEFVTKNN